MSHRERITQIQSSDFEAFISEVAAGIWNKLLDNPAFMALTLKDFPEIFEAVSGVLHPYESKKMLKWPGGRRS